jgi:hypothetical protein
VAHTLFSDRISESWGAPEQVLRRFLIERRLDIPGYDGQLFAARSRDDGTLVWLKHPLEPAGGMDRAQAEQAVLGSLDHPHIIRLARFETGADSLPEGWVAYTWSGEEPLDGQRLAQLPPAGRIRLAAHLLGVLAYLQKFAEPVAHLGLDYGALWVTPSLGWLRLSLFDHVVSGASGAELARDREAAWRLAQEMLAGCCAEAEGLAAAGQQWVAGGGAGLAALLRELKLAYLACITADL